MTDIVLTPITSGYNLSKINANFVKVQDAVNNDVLHNTGGNNVMHQSLDMNFNKILNVFTDVNDPESLLTMGVADARYYNVSGDTLTGTMNAGGQRITNLPAPSTSTEPVRKGEYDVSSASAVRAPLGEMLSVLPPAGSRANKVMGFDASGNPLASLPASGSGTELAIDLANDVDPLKGLGLIGYARSPLGIAMRGAKRLLDSTSVSIWEYVGFADKSGGPTYDLWDWTLAINTALATGASINMGTGSFKVSNRLVLAADNQSLIGYGATIRTTASGTAGTVVYALGRSGVKVTGLHIIPGAVSGPLWTSGSAVLLDGCSGFILADLEVSGGRRGLSVVDSKDGVITNNWCHDSLVHASPSTATQFGADIGLYNNCSNISVTGNVCVRGCGQGIAVQTNGVTGHTVKSITITGNIIQFQDAYGILLYSDGANAVGPNPDVFRLITLGHNTIEDITGAIPNPFNSSLSFGAGIYIQGVEGSVLVGNTVRRANLATVSALLGPGGIALVNATSANWSANWVENCGKHGFFMSDPLSKGIVGGCAQLSNNTALSNGEHGFHCNDFRAAIFSANASKLNTRYGFFCRNQNTTNSRLFTFSLNVSESNGQNGITVANGDSVLVANQVSDNLGAGITVGGGTTQLDINTVARSGGRGIEIQPDCTDATTRGNILDGNPTQMFLRAPARGLETNIIRNTPGGGTDFGGDFPIETSLTGATPSVKNGRFFSKADTVSVTGFTGGHTGQEITIRASSGTFTLINGGPISTATGADVNVLSGRSITLRFIASAWRQSL